MRVWRSLACGVLVAGVLAGCGGGAATRFEQAVQRIAVTLGRSTDEVASGLRAKLPGAAIEDLATQAERTAAETTVLEGVAAKQAVREAERVEMLAAVHEAACDGIGIISAMDEASPEDRETAFVNAIVSRMTEHRLDPSLAKAEAIYDAALGQINAVADNGSIDTGQAAIDLACL